MPRVKTVYKKDEVNAFGDLSHFANFHKSGSIIGMKQQYYGRDALLVRCGQYIYNVTPCPAIYYNVAH